MNPITYAGAYVIGQPKCPRPQIVADLGSEVERLRFEIEPVCADHPALL